MNCLLLSFWDIIYFTLTIYIKKRHSQTPGQMKTRSVKLHMTFISSCSLLACEHTIDRKANLIFIIILWRLRDIEDYTKSNNKWLLMAKQELKPSRLILTNTWSQLTRWRFVVFFNCMGRFSDFSNWK